MSQLITWTVAGGSLVFALGMISAIGSRYKARRQPKSIHTSLEAELAALDRSIVSERLTDARLRLLHEAAMQRILDEKKASARKTEYDMAARGAANGSQEDSLAAIGSRTR